MRSLIILAVVCAFISGCQQPPSKDFYRRPGAAFSDLRFPLVQVSPDLAALHKFKSTPLLSQPWMQGSRIEPKSIEDLGLRGILHLALFEEDLYDAALKIIVADEEGHLFAFCAVSGPTAYSPFGDAFLLGDLKLSKQLVRVDPGSPSHTFLRKLIWSFAKVKSYQFDKEYLERVRVNLGLSKQDFLELMNEPDFKRGPKTDAR